MNNNPDKLLVASSFSAAASHYDDVAGLQRQTADDLLSGLAELAVSPKIILDLGTGTGRNLELLQQLYPQAKLLALDFAAQMIRQAKTRSAARENKVGFIVGDIERLPLQANSVDLIFANLALQWCDPLVSFQEAKRVLKPGGMLAFTSLEDGTLDELKQAWRGVDHYPHVNEFLALATLKAQIKRCFGMVELSSKPYVLYFDSVIQIMRDLKQLGAHNVSQQRRRGMTGKKALQTVIDSYESYRIQQGLPVTYHVIHGVAIKPLSHPTIKPASCQEMKSYTKDVSL